MPYNSSRRARERRLRAKYRKKIATAVIITLIIGLIVGFVLCVLSVNRFDAVSKMLKIGPVNEVVSVVPTITSVPEVGNEDVLSTAAPEVGNETMLSFNEPESEPVNAFNVEAENNVAPAPTAEVGFVDPAVDGETEIGAFNEEEVGDFDSFVGEEFSEPDAFAATPNEGNQVAIVAMDEVPAEVEAVNTPLEETVEPEAAPEAEEIPEEVVEEEDPYGGINPVIVPFGESVLLQTQIKADGTARTEATDEPYESLDIYLQVYGHHVPEYFELVYGDQYKLQGDETCVALEALLADYAGTTKIIPQNFLPMTLVGEDPSITNLGYQLMDAEIGGKTDIALESDFPALLYKRYSYSAEQGEMKYLSVTTYFEGEEDVYWFELTPLETYEIVVPGDPNAPALSAQDNTDQPAAATNVAVNEPAAAPASSGEGLTVGSKGDEVTKLQRVLIKLGLLQGSPDGKFGNYTAEAVRIMQGRYGMEKTGVADAAFLERLYAENP